MQPYPTLPQIGQQKAKQCISSQKAACRIERPSFLSLSLSLSLSPFCYTACLLLLVLHRPELSKGSRDRNLTRM